MGEVSLLFGGVRTGKSTVCISRYRDAVTRGSQSSMLILPTVNQVEQVRRDLLLKSDDRALWQPRILTFPELATEILDSVNYCAPLVSTVGERAMMRIVIRRLEHWLVYFSRVRHYTGFIDSLCDFIGELKRAGIEPPVFEEKLKSANLFDTKSRELARIYRDYQDLLLESDLYDVEGRFWMAREILARGAGFVWPEHLFIDGFENFTTTQIEMLESLSERAMSTLVTLTYDPEDSRKDLFDTTRRTFEALRKRLPTIRMEQYSVLANEGTLPHLSRQLFHHQPQQIESDGAIELVESPGRRKEVEAIARKIKSLLIEGCPPEDIGVLARSLSDYGDVVRTVFSRAGIPLRAGQWLSAESQTVSRTILCMLRIVQKDFRFSEVIQFLNSNYVRFDPFDETALEDETFTPDDLAIVARKARIVGGKAQWMTRLAALHNRYLSALSESDPHDDDNDLARLMKSTRSAKLTLSYMGAFVKAFESLPDEGTHGEFTTAVIGLINFFRIPTHLVDPHARYASSANVRAYQQVVSCLQEMRNVGRTLQTLEGQGVTVTLDEFVRDLRTSLGHSVFQGEGSRQGRVSVMEAHQARQMSFKHVFLCGLVEKGFPRPREEDIFFNDRERQQLRRSGLMLEQRLPQQRDEAMLFYGAACSAEVSLTLSYPVTNAEGREVLTSYYVDEVTQCFSNTIPATRVRLSDVVATTEEMVDQHEFRERTFLDGRLGDALPSDLRNEPAWRNALAGAAAEVMRSGLPDNAFSGNISSVQSLDRIRNRFDESHTYSANQLNSLGSCPYQYFAGYVLKLNAPEEYREEANQLERGSVMHDILARFFGVASREEALGTTRLTPENLAEARVLMNKVAHRFFSEQISRGTVGDPQLWQHEKRNMLRHLQSVLDMEVKLNSEDEKRGRSFTPTLFEQRFGWDDGTALLLETKSGPITLRGIIDRVDFSDTGDSFRVWDYKLGRSHHPSDTLRGTDFQIPIYVHATQKMTERKNCERCGYLAIQRPAEPSGVAYAEPSSRDTSLGEVMAAADETIPKLVDALKAGHFEVSPASPETCTYCSYRSLCRVVHK